MIKDHPLRELNTWKVGGEADYFIQPKTLEELKEAYLWGLNSRKPVTVLSGGSNVLISDKGIEGLVISMQSLAKVEEPRLEGEKLLCIIGSGASKSELLKIFLKHKLSAALFLAGLPGDVGGGVVMNAGVGYEYNPREFCEITNWIEILRLKNTDLLDHDSQTYISAQQQGHQPLTLDQLEVKRLGKDDLQWEYRQSTGWQPGIITRVEVAWPNEPQVDIMKSIKEATRKRVQSQPLTQPSCGSTFRNPEGAKSGQLIESCGLKGHRIGGAEVSKKHANFIVTDESAKAADVMNLIRFIQDKVKSETGFALQTEVKLMGRW